MQYCIFLYETERLCGWKEFLCIKNLLSSFLVSDLERQANFKHMGAAQELQQNVCQKYGWSIDFSSGEDGCWCVEVIVGIGDKRRFVAPTKQEKKEAPTKQEKKEGKEAVSALALEGLAKEIEREESKPTKTLAEIFSHKKITIYDSSNPATWDFFWKKPPKVVGIDTEGNQVSPPVLVQISTEDYTILEVPTKKNISTNLQRLLDDSRITKVFCDNFSHR